MSRADRTERGEQGTPGEGEPTRSSTVGGWNHTKASVVAEQNAHGGMTLRDCETSAAYPVVEYASPSVRGTARSLERGTVVEGWLVRVGCRANAWRMLELTVVDDR